MKRLELSRTERPFKQFEVLPCISGFEVIDSETGRCVDRRETKRQANGVAHKLNQAAADKSVAFALGGA